MPGARGKSRQPKKEAFLAAYAGCGNISQAAKLAKVNRDMHRRWLKDDPDYGDKFDAAHEQACDSLEQEARRRAVDGVNSPVFYKGAKVATVKEYSDTLLIFLMKGAMPDKYRERVDQRQSGSVDVNHSGQVDVAAVRQGLLNDPDYLEYRRSSAVHDQPGAVCHDGQQPEVANGKAPRGSGPSTNGHSNGAH